MGNPKKPEQPEGPSPDSGVQYGKVPTLSDIDISDDDTEGMEYTPITNFGDLGRAVSAIKRGQDRTAMAVEGLDRAVREEVKPKIDKVVERTVNLETRARASEARLKVLENDSKQFAIGVGVHECFHDEDFKDIDENEKQVLHEIGTIIARVSVAETNIQTAIGRTKEEVEKTDRRWSRLAGALLTVALFAIGGVGAWVVTLVTVRADVKHLSEEQSKFRGEVTNSISNDAKRVEKAAKRVETVVATPPSAPPVDPLELLWCDLSEREKTRQKKIRGGKIPDKRCP